MMDDRMTAKEAAKLFSAAGNRQEEWAQNAPMDA